MLTTSALRLVSFVRRLHTADAWLTVTGLLMLAVLAATTAGLWLDPRVIAGAPAWLKPSKFALAAASYSLTLAWLFTFLTGAPRTRYVVSRVTSVVFVLEVALVALQAWRGTTSQLLPFHARHSPSSPSQARVGRQSPSSQHDTAGLSGLRQRV